MKKLFTFFIGVVSALIPVSNRGSRCFNGHLYSHCLEKDGTAITSNIIKQDTVFFNNQAKTLQKKYLNVQYGKIYSINIH